MKKKKLLKKLKKLVGKPVQMVWEDAFSQYGWISPEELKDAPLKIVSIGFLVQASRRGVSVTTSLDERHVSADPLYVPLDGIVEIGKLK